MIGTSDRSALLPSKGALRRDLDPDSQEWIERLTPGSPDLEAGTQELHSLLLRGARFEVSRRRAMLPHLWGDDYDDLAQQSADDALLAVLRKLDDFHGDSRFTTWAYKFALFEAAAAVRTRAWQGRAIPIESESWGRLASCAPTAQEDLEMKELFATLKEAMATRLSVHQREVLVAVALNDVPIDVLAARLGKSRGAIYKTLHDARQKLRAAVKPAGSTRAVGCNETSNEARATARRTRRSRRFPPKMGTVIATPAAIDAIMRLRVEHRAIAFRESGGEVTEAKLPPRINELQLGEVGGVPFLIDADQYKRWGCPDLVVDVSHSSDGRALAEGADCIRLTLSRNGSLSP